MNKPVSKNDHIEKENSRERAAALAVAMEDSFICGEPDDFSYMLNPPHKSDSPQSTSVVIEKKCAAYNTGELNDSMNKNEQQAIQDTLAKERAKAVALVIKDTEDIAKSIEPDGYIFSYQSSQTSKPGRPTPSSSSQKSLHKNQQQFIRDSIVKGREYAASLVIDDNCIDSSKKNKCSSEKHLDSNFSISHGNSIENGHMPTENPAEPNAAVPPRSGSTVQHLRTATPRVSALAKAAERRRRQSRRSQALPGAYTVEGITEISSDNDEGDLSVFELVHQDSSQEFGQASPGEGNIQHQRGARQRSSKFRTSFLPSAVIQASSQPGIMPIAMDRENSNDKSLPKNSEMADGSLSISRSHQEVSPKSAKEDPRPQTVDLEDGIPIEEAVIGLDAKNEQRRFNRKWMCLITLALAVVIGVSLGFLKSNSSDGNDPTKRSDADEETSSTPYALLPSVSYLSSNKKVFEDPESPQSKALKWLEEVDEMGQIWVEDTTARQEVVGLSTLQTRYALAVFFMAMGGDSAGSAWTDQMSFLGLDDVCEWHTSEGEGVMCEGSDVTALIFETYNNLRGEVPEEIKALSNLRTLRIKNQSDASSITSIRGVDNLGVFPELQVLDLSGNAIFEELPSSFATLSNLTELYLNDNRFRGQIPTSYDQLSAIRILELQNNNLEGFADRGMYAMLELEKLRLDGNSLSLQNFFLTNNRRLTKLNLDGIKGTNEYLSLVQYLDQLESFSWENGQIEGEMPVGVLQLPHLEKLSLRKNELSGTIPWTKLNENLVLLDLSSNRLSGGILDALSQLQRLESLMLNENDLTGMLPTGIGRLSKLTKLDLSDNSLHGNLPVEMQSLSQLEQLGISNNGLTREFADICQAVPSIQITLTCSGDFSTEICNCCTCSDL